MEVPVGYLLKCWLDELVIANYGQQVAKPTHQFAVCNVRYPNLRFRKETFRIVQRADAKDIQLSFG